MLGALFLYAKCMIETLKMRLQEIDLNQAPDKTLITFQFINKKAKSASSFEFYLRSPYLIIISAICHCHSFKNELVLVLNTAWRKQPIADNVSNHNRTCGESVSENSE